MKNSNYKLSIAPMLDISDTHFRSFMRLLSKRTVLYTEMIVDNTIKHAYLENRLDKYLKFDLKEKPIIAQVAGSNPESLAFAAKVLADYGYDGINLNAGCPSDRVQAGAFGACLMKKPNLISDCLEAMQKASNLPVSLKHRIGVDEFDSLEWLINFIETTKKSGIKHFIIHARKAWLKGLSPAQNRTVPKLNKDFVYQVKNKFNDLFIEINGEIKSLDSVLFELNFVDACMIGRAAADNPWLFQKADSKLFNEKDPIQSRFELLDHLQEKLCYLVEQQQKQQKLLRHILNIFNGERGARKWRQFVTEEAIKNPQSQDILLRSKSLLEY